MQGDSAIRRDLKNAGFVEMWSDMNLTYGGMWVRPEERSHDQVPNYYDVIEITDLDSACGADGQVLVTSRSTSFDYAHKGELKSAVASHGGEETIKRVAREDKAGARLLLAAWLAEYGIADPNGYGDGCFVATIDREAHKGAREPWEATVNGWGWAAFRRAVQEAIEAS